ncbi:MAG TPA: prolipoprotein diacylglyceryl transferase family protein [Anaeromyxobacter sp.]|nr:prolipoprotein diacylglyceryl transferase family protein [Anaeromyxobacter sp.]
MPLALIPSFQLPSLELGPITIQSFGVLTALGVLTAVWLSGRAARQLGKDPQVIVDFSVVGILAGVLVGHLVHAGFYHPEEGREALGLIGKCLSGEGCSDVGGAFKVWEGLSSMGGLVGGIAAAAIWFRRKKIPFADYSDAFALGIAPGWGVARVGCFTVHDHPGVRSDFFLAVKMNGVPRHDLGLYEAILLFALAALLWTLHRRDLLRGRLLALLAVLYGVARFFLDFLRARPGDVGYADGRVFGLTAAQYIVIVLAAYGAWRLSRPRPPGRQAGQGKAA